MHMAIVVVHLAVDDLSGLCVMVQSLACSTAGPDCHMLSMAVVALVARPSLDQIWPTWLQVLCAYRQSLCNGCPQYTWTTSRIVSHMNSCMHAWFIAGLVWAMQLNSDHWLHLAVMQHHHWHWRI